MMKNENSEKKIISNDRVSYSKTRNDIRLLRSTGFDRSQFPHQTEHYFQVEFHQRATFSFKFFGVKNVGMRGRNDHPMSCKDKLKIFIRKFSIGKFPKVSVSFSIESPPSLR